MIAGSQILARAATGFLNSVSIYERFLACQSRRQRCRGLALKARAVVAHDRLLAGRLPRGDRA